MRAILAYNQQLVVQFPVERTDSGTMKRQVLLFSVVVVLAGGVGWALWQRAPSAVDKNKVVQSLSTVDRAVAARATSTGNVDLARQPQSAKLSVARSPRVESVPVPGKSVVALRADVAAAYACAGCEADSPFAAKSAAEAAWMSSRGFPTREQLENMWSLDRSALRALADHGNLVATGLLGTLLVQDGRISEGLGELAKARQDGSIYALYAWSDWLRSENNPNGNKYLAAAYIRLAYLMGDAKAAAYLYKTFPDMDRFALAQIDQRAADIFRRLNKMRVAEFGTPLQIVSRPDPQADEDLRNYRPNH